MWVYGEGVDIDVGRALQGPHDALGHVRRGQRGLDARVDGVGGGPAIFLLINRSWKDENSFIKHSCENEKKNEYFRLMLTVSNLKRM